MNYKTSLFVLQQIRKISTTDCLGNKHKNHYDSLGIPKTATQADVKSAYYKLSKMYHPDTNKGNEEHSQKFREVTEAYEILGNVKNRKMYDKGFFMGHVHHHDTTPHDPLHKFYKSRETRTRPPPPTGQTPIYDFDSWAKAHYGETFQRSQAFKQKNARMDRLRQEHKNDQKHELLFAVCLITIGICMYLGKHTTDYDIVALGGMPVSVVKENSDDERK